ncbi:VTC domain-containing protein [Amycolatopsis xylanica]|uniref:VTC domain-containing protein n=1 Tax=Amycolatopsis xylanica TaxID=589385 RepID=A0A1H2VXH3_9PSEU|nr:polyphosphate polymerase domain-containing protein [Amycolatopsis xylanica]SDW73045.1 VTC domain-containing protein [Amycolatopsis xylanica]
MSAADRGTAVVDAVTAGLPALSLAEVVATSALMSRTDRKYLLRPSEFLALAEALRPELSCLEIAGGRSFRYSSTYFDTPGLAVFRAHRQDRRRRFKIRTRTYADSADTFCELKLNGRRDETIKVRRPHPTAAAHTLTASTLEFLDEQLMAAYGTRAPRPLTASLVTTYRRATLVTADRLTRITCDTALTWSSGRHDVPAARDLVLLEVKSAAGRGPATEALSRLRLHELSVSKYCAGLVALGLAQGGNRWLPALRRLAVHSIG